MKHLVIGLVALGLAGCSMPEPVFKASSTTPTETISVTAESLWQEYKTNPVRAEETMKNKRVRMTGTLLAITPNNDKSVGLSFAANEQDGDHFVFVVFPESFRPQVAELNPKQTVTVEGTFKRHDRVFVAQTLTFDGSAILK